MVEVIVLVILARPMAGISSSNVVKLLNTEFLQSNGGETTSSATPAEIALKDRISGT